MATVKVADLLVAITADAKGFKAEMDAVAGKMKQTGKDMESIGGKLSANVSLPLLGVGIASAKMAMEFNHAFTTMRVLVGLTSEEMQGWKEDIHELAIETGRSSRELANAMFFITSAGLRGATAMAALEASAKGAAIGMGDTKTIAFATVSAVNAFGIAAEEVDKVVAQLMMTVRYGNLEASTLAPVLGQVIPVASELSVGLDQVGAALAAMTRLGVDSHMAATSLKQILMTILKPSDQAKEALLNVGLSAAGLRQELREKGLLSVLMTLRGAMASNEEGLATVFDNVRALTGVLNLMGKNVETTKMIFDGMAQTVGEDLNDGFEVVTETAGHKFKVALAELDSVMVDLGATTMPPLVEQMTRLSDAASSSVEAFDKLDPAVKDLTVDLGLLLIVLGPGLEVLGMFTRSVATGVGTVGALGTAAVAVRTPLTGLAGVMMAGTSATGATAAAIGLASSALAVLAGYIGWFAGSKFNDWLMKQEAWAKLTGNIANQEKEYANQLLKDEEVWEMTYNAYEKMREKVGATGDEFYISKEATKESAEQMARLMPVMQQMVQQQNQQTTALRETKDAQDQLAKDVEEQKAKEAKLADDYLQKLREEYDIYTKGDVLKAISDRTQHYKDMVKLGVEEKMLRGGITDKLVEEVGMLADYKVKWSELPEETRKMLTELAKFSPELQTQIDKVGSLGGTYEALFREVSAGFADPKTGIAHVMGDTLKGGFEQGFDAGIDAGQEKLAAFARKMEEKPVQIPAELVIDWSKFQQVMDDLSKGNLPPSGGAVP